jgi:hypothetical protein
MVSRSVAIPLNVGVTTEIFGKEGTMRVVNRLQHDRKIRYQFPASLLIWQPCFSSLRPALNGANPVAENSE